MLARHVIHQIGCQALIRSGRAFNANMSGIDDVAVGLPGPAALQADGCYLVQATAGRTARPVDCQRLDFSPDRYGNGDIRVTTQQNLIIPNISEDRIGALTDEPLFSELPFDPSPIMRGLVSCTGNDYCSLALIETKGYAVQVARELEKRTAGRKIQPLTIHWSGCPAGCGLHQVATIGLQGCRSRQSNGDIVDAAHVCVKGATGPNPRLATDLMYDVPCEQLAEALEPLVSYLPR